MNKEDFIRDLTDTLQGEVTDYELNDSIGYYRDYFNQEMAAGRSEEEVLQELGSPKLIGRSIIDARGIDEMAEREGQSYQSYQSYDDRGMTQVIRPAKRIRSAQLWAGSARRSLRQRLWWQFSLLYSPWRE